MTSNKSVTESIKTLKGTSKEQNKQLLSKSSIHISMLYPLLIMTAAFALFSLLIFLMKYNTELIKIKNKGLDRL